MFAKSDCSEKHTVKAVRNLHSDVVCDQRNYQNIVEHIMLSEQHCVYREVENIGLP